MALARRTPSWSLTCWQPARELQRLSEEMDRWLPEAFGGAGESDWLMGAWASPVALSETDDAFTLRSVPALLLATC